MFQSVLDSLVPQMWFHCIHTKAMSICWLEFCLKLKYSSVKQNSVSYTGDFLDKRVVFRSEGLELSYLNGNENLSEKKRLLF